jgi:hypothetical protein
MVDDVYDYVFKAVVGEGVPVLVLSLKAFVA